MSEAGSIRLRSVGHIESFGHYRFWGVGRLEEELLLRGSAKRTARANERGIRGLEYPSIGEEEEVRELI